MKLRIGMGTSMGIIVGLPFGRAIDRNRGTRIRVIICELDLVKEKRKASKETV